MFGTVEEDEEEDSVEEPEALARKKAEMDKDRVPIFLTVPKPAGDDNFS